MTEQPHIPPDPGASAARHDRRGALVLGGLGLVGLGVSMFYAFTEMTYFVLVEVTAPLGFSFALLVAALVRFWRGRPLKDGTALVTLHQEVRSHAYHNLLRFVSLAIDTAICAALGAFILMALDEFFPRSLEDFYTWALDPDKNDLQGMEFWRAAMQVVGTSEAQFILGPMLVAGLCGMLILVPAVTWGATIGMLICGFRWVRAKDGQRVGALHAFLRFLATAVCAAPQAALLVLGTMFGMRKMKVVRTGRKFLDKSVLRDTWGARRTLADLASRTETLRPSSYS